MKSQLLPLPILMLLISCVSCDKTSDHLFLEISHKKSGINFRNTLRESPEFNVMKYSYFYNGGGVAVGDVNNDGLCDVYFTGNLVASHLYINKGDWKFTNMAKDAGVEAAGLWNTGVNMIDINADGWLDIYVCRSAAKDPDARRNLLFINRSSSDSEQVIFEEQGAAYGLNDAGYSTQSAFFDYDRDGDLDMYLLNHSVQEFANFNTFLGNLKARRNPDYGDKLYRNDQGRFTDVSNEAGIKSNVLGFGLGVSIGDFNDDSWPDIYISNDYNEEDYLYLNQHDGTFIDQLSMHIDHASLFSMGSDAADINNDGLTDLVTLDMLPEDNYRIKLTSGSDNFDKYQLLLQQGFYKQSMRNMLHINQGNSFSEVGQMAGISNTDWSWSALLADYDLDGLQDLFVTNGYLRDYTNMDFLSFAVDMKLNDQDIASESGIQELLEHMPKIEVPNQIFKNLDGLTFKDHSKAWGFSKIELSNGAAYADLDNDGDLDLIVNNINDFAGIYRNTASERKMGNFIKIRLDFQDGRTSAIGSHIKICTPSGEFHRDLHLSRGFQSSIEPILHFGLGNIDKIDSLIVTWPDGTLESFDYVPINAIYIAKNGTGSPRQRSERYPNPLFKQEEVLAFKHQENDFNDFRIQSLLPKYYSRSGPPLGVADINMDGLTDVVCGGAKGQECQVFLGTPSGDFTAMQQNDLALDKDYEDVDLVLRDVNQDERPDLVIASGGNANEEGNLQYALRLYLNNGQGEFIKEKSFETILSNAQCLVVEDLNQDGFADIFVGSAYKAQKYPLSEENYLLLNNGKGQFTQLEGLPFASSVVMDAEIVDYDKDGHSELIIVGEWEPLQIYSLQSDDWTLEQQSEEKGWFNTVHVANLDSDPELELIVGNLGLNSQLMATMDKPLVLYYGDFDKNNTIDPILSCYIGNDSYPFVSRDDLLGQLPALKKLFTSYHDYALFNMQQLLQSLPDPATDTINELTSGIYDLANNKLVKVALPAEAQVAPVFSILDIDYDGDGDQDLLLTGNNEFNRVKLGEMDANHGVLLRNDVNLNFVPIPNTISGLDLKGDVRSSVEIVKGDDTYLIFGVNDRNVISYKLNKKPVQ